MTQAQMKQEETQSAPASKNAINWFEIPVADFERAARFYESMLSIQLKRGPFGEEQFAIFPADEQGVAGTLVKGAGRKPAGEGTMIYLDAPELEEALVRAPSAGGRIAMPMTSIGPMGHIATVIDTEGNRIGLHRAPRG